MFPVSIKGVLRLPNGQVVLALNDRDEWELPGGRIEVGESAPECLAREFKEELDVEVRVSSIIDSYLFEVIPGKQVFIVTYGCELVGPFAPEVSDEHLRIATFALDALPANLPPGYAHSIHTFHALTN
ncbi:NUDIX hydrolase [Halomonas sp. PAMB 3232]|uniref:NUDIX hydrolase n=1 Tax=Halomonas sp. PAMB 3232 TaxID=3075221 RepID=UPI0028A0932C|nr:NUDIX hydrolase [Halomonas sp. PAMB 3232]WNL40012.1 NUDIX hydrolase [Halomonas sp. PAMB 3232]